MKPQRIDTTGRGNPLVHNPFAGIESGGLPPGGARPDPPSPPAAPAAGRRREPNRNRGRVDVVRQTAGRGGKTVTVLSGFKGIGSPELHDLARAIQRACGVGGTVKGSTIEIQGDQRDRAMTVLEEAGFRPVRAGG